MFLFISFSWKLKSNRIDVRKIVPLFCTIHVISENTFANNLNKQKFSTSADAVLYVVTGNTDPKSEQGSKFSANNNLPVSGVPQEGRDKRGSPP